MKKVNNSDTPKNPIEQTKGPSRNEQVVLEQIIETIPYFVFWKDTNSCYLGANERFAKSAGFSSVSEMIGKDDYEACWTNEETEFFRSMDREVMKNNRPILNIEEPQKQLDGSTKTLLTSKVPLHGKNGEVVGILGIYTDITSRKKLEIEKDNALKELKEIQSQLIQTEKLRSLGEMAGGIAHEINNPLAIIKGTVSVLKKSILNKSYNDDTLLHSIERINDTLNRIGSIVQSMKNISRESRQDHITEEPISNIIQDVKAVCSEKLNSLGVRIEIDDSQVKDSVLNCNRISLSQILLNLVNNSNDAIKNCAEKWIKIQLSITDKFKIKVIDSGNGIKPDIASKIFQPFFTTKEIGSGTGIGLSLSQSLAQKQFAQLSYDSSNANTCFVLEFPLTSLKNLKKAG